MSQSDRINDEPIEGRVVASTKMSSWVVGGGEETVVSVKWHEGEFNPARQGTMGGREHEEPRWFGSKVLEEPGR